MSSDLRPAEAPEAPHAPRRAKRSARRARRLAITLSVFTLVVLGAGYTVACALAPLPTLQLNLNEAAADTTVSVDGAVAQAAVDAQTLPTAIGWADGTEVWSNDEKTYPLGSVSKLITVLVCLETQPFEAGTDGPTYTWTQHDRERQDHYLSLEGVAYPLPVGTQLTQRQMFEFIFLPSSNDFAEAYAMSVFGDNETFLKAFEVWKEKHGLDSIQFVESTGMDEHNQSNAADLVRVARLALENPTVAEFNRMKYADMPWGIGRIENTNPLLGVVPGVIGTKTGALAPVGYNLIVSQQVDAFGREIINIAANLARPTKEQRAANGRSMLELMAPMPQQLPVVAAGEAIGSVTTWQGTEVPLVTEGAASAVLLPGETARRATTVDVHGAAAEGTSVGAVTVTAPAGEHAVSVVTTAPIAEPSLWWRLTHPFVLWGGAHA